MTEVRFTRTATMLGVKIEGHQGTSIECAAVSAMGCMLINALAAENLMVEPVAMHDEGLLMATCLRTPRTEAMYDMLRRGFEAMQEKMPDKIKVY